MDNSKETISNSIQAEPASVQSKVEVPDSNSTTVIKDWDKDVETIPRLQVIDENQKFT